MYNKIHTRLIQLLPLLHKKIVLYQMKMSNCIELLQVMCWQKRKERKGVRERKVQKVSYWECHAFYSTNVVYFDPHLDAARSKYWSKYGFHHFLCKIAEKGRQSKNTSTKFSKKNFFWVCTRTLVESFFPRKNTFSVLISAERKKHATSARFKLKKYFFDKFCNKFLPFSAFLHKTLVKLYNQQIV